MSATMRNIGLGIGVLALVVVAAFAGWVMADRFSGGGDTPDTVSVLRYPLVPRGEDADATLEWIGQEQDQTALAMSQEASTVEPLGSPEAGGQSTRALPVSVFPPVVTEDTVEADDDTTTSTGSIGSGDAAEPEIPSEAVFEDAPYLRGIVDLSDVVIADPIGTLDIDICAGPARLPETPLGCPIGFGGTIVPFDGSLPGDSSPAGGRPPTGFTAFGTDTLYVRMFRRSSLAEHTAVKAVPWSADWTRPEQGCEPGEDPRGPEGILTVPRPTIPIDTASDPTGWPWDPEFDTIDLYALDLTSGTEYAICTYWLDTSAPGTVVTFWESTRVATASARHMKVSVIGYDTVNLSIDQDPIGPFDVLTVNSSCDGYTSFQTDWPGVGRFERLSPSWTLCDVGSMSGILQNGGIPIVSVIHYEDLTPPTASRAWLDIDRDDVLCERDCSYGFVTGVALPDVDHAATGSGRTTRWRAGRLNLAVEFDDPIETRTGWVLGEPESFDTSDRLDPPPVLRLVNAVPGTNDYTLMRVGDGSFGTYRSFVIGNDVPVTVSAELLDWSGGPPCVPGGGTPPAYDSDGASTSHFFSFEGLCLGTSYALRVTAVDDAGVAYDVSNRRYTGDSANLYSFRTRDVSEHPQMYATLILPDQPGLGACFQVGEFRLSPASAGVHDNMRETLDVERAWITARWYQSQVQPQLVENKFDATLPSPPITFRLADVEPHEMDNWISISTQMIPDSPCWPRTVGFPPPVWLSANPTLTELFAGVTITNGTDTYPQLQVRAVWPHGVPTPSV